MVEVMGAMQIEVRHPDLLPLARRFYALGDEIRLCLLGLLRGGERCVCELTACLALAQSRLSFHLKVLKDAGLITHRREGRWSYYALDPAAFEELERFLGQLPGGAAAAPCCLPSASALPSVSALPSPAGRPPRAASNLNRHRKELR